MSVKDLRQKIESGKYTKNDMLAYLNAKKITGINSFTTSQLEEVYELSIISVKELKKEARLLKIKGINTMKKSKLIHKIVSLGSSINIQTKAMARKNRRRTANNFIEQGPVIDINGLTYVDIENNDHIMHFHMNFVDYANDLCKIYLDDPDNILCNVQALYGTEEIDNNGNQLPLNIKYTKAQVVKRDKILKYDNFTTHSSV